MAGYPLGGMDVQNNDLGGVALFDVVFGDGNFLGGAQTYPEGTIVARVAGVLGPCDTTIATIGTDATTTPVGVLGSDVTSDGVTPQPIRFIVSGQVRLSKLSGTTAGDQDDPAVQDALRDYGIIPDVTTDLSKLDNQ